MSIAVVATIKPLPQHRSKVADALKQLVRTAHQEPGVECFALHEGQDEFVIIEKWVDQASVDAHIAAPLSDALQEVIATCLQEAPTHQYLTPIPQGDQLLGVI